MMDLRRRLLPSGWDSGGKPLVTVHGIFETPNSKHQIPNTNDPNTNDLNYFDFSSIDENIFFNSFSELECPFFKIYTGLLFGILVTCPPSLSLRRGGRVGICLSFAQRRRLRRV